MKELGEALKLIFEKIADFFDIFDLSFFVSGIASATAVATYANLTGTSVADAITSPLGTFVAALASYTLGLVSFASGRWIRMSLWPLIWHRDYKFEYHIKWSNNIFATTLKSHGLWEKEAFKTYLSGYPNDRDGIRRLYVLLWADIRQSNITSSSLQLGASLRKPTFG